MKIKSSENIKKIIFRLTWEKQLVVLCKASIEYILSMVIVGLIQNSINILQAHLNIPQGFEIIHNFQNLSLYVIFIIINFLQISLQQREDTRSGHISPAELHFGDDKTAVTTFDICHSGIGIISPVSLKVGEKARLFNSSFPYSYEDVVVRWYDEMSKRAGLMFIKNR